MIELRSINKIKLINILCSMVKRKLALLVFVIIAICGCAPPLVPSKYDISSPSMLVTKIPVRIGLYLSPLFQNATLRGNKGGMEYTLLIGEL